MGKSHRHSDADAKPFPGCELTDRELEGIAGGVTGDPSPTPVPTPIPIDGVDPGKLKPG
jgi:hypothetical protein